MHQSANPRRRSALLATVLSLLVGGCQDPTAPSPVEGTFVLRSVGTQPVPAVTGVLLNTEFSLLADTIALRADGTGDWLTTSARRDLQTDARDTTWTTVVLEHRRRGATVRATALSCEQHCDVFPAEVAFVLDGDWLTRGTGTAARRYRRIGPDA